MSQSSDANPIEEVVDFFTQAPSREEIAAFHLSDAAQEHIRDLLAKNAAGTLTREENRNLDKIMVLNDVVSLIRARVQGAQASHGNRTTASSALPGA